MRDLKDTYREGLGGQIDALVYARAGLDEAGGEAKVSIRRIAHRLKGSGATFGFPEISAAAADVESAGGTEFAARVETLIEVLRKVAGARTEEDLTVLVVEDDAGDAEITTRALSAPNRKILLARTFAEAERTIGEEDIGLAVLDLVLPDGDGRNLLVHLRENSRTASVPVMVTSSLKANHVKAECYALGAEQFIEKPVDANLLATRVSATIQQRARLSRETHIDTLTGLPNRAAFRQAFRKARALASRNRSTLSVAILDLDRFKSVNDRFGHGVGDEVLRKASEVISESIRLADTLARWGGEEFVALFPDTMEEGAVKALEHALEVLKTSPLRLSGGQELRVTFSAGAAEAGDDASLDDVIAQADRVLYLAKGSGRSRVYCSKSRIPIPTKRILLAEDDDLVAQTVVQMFALNGIEVIHCSTGAEALRSAGRMNISLGILDVNMPGMDGFELLEKLREIPETASVPMMMLTGRGSERDVVRGFQMGADDYIVKPFATSELEARVHRLLNR